jgi:hypothetical protein
MVRPTPVDRHALRGGRRRGRGHRITKQALKAGLRAGLIEGSSLAGRQIGLQKSATCGATGRGGAYDEDRIERHLHCHRGGPGDSL